MMPWGRKLVRCKSKQHIWAHGGQNTGNTCVLTKTHPRCYILFDLTKASFRATLHKTLCNFSQAEQTSARWVSLRCKIDGVLKVIRDARIIFAQREDQILFFNNVFRGKSRAGGKSFFYLSRMQRPPCWVTFSPVWPVLASVFKELIRFQWVSVAFISSPPTVSHSTCQSASHLDTQLECQIDKPVSHPVNLPAFSAHQPVSQTTLVCILPSDSV